MRTRKSLIRDRLSAFWASYKHIIVSLSADFTVCIMKGADEYGQKEDIEKESQKTC